MEEYPVIDLKTTQVKFGPDKVINKDLRIDVFDERSKIYIADKKNLYKDVYIEETNGKCKQGEVWRCVKTGFPGLYRWICITTSNKKLSIWRSIYGKSCRLPWGITFSIVPDLTVLYTNEVLKELYENTISMDIVKEIDEDFLIEDFIKAINNEHF